MTQTTSISELRDDANLAVLIRQVREGLLRRLDRDLAASDIELNHSQYLVLKIIAKHGPQMPGDLARWLDHNAGAMTRLIDRLEDKGYVRRQAHAEDRRALSIELTQAGQALWHTISACSERMLSAALHDLKKNERATLLALLKRVRDTLEKSQ
ncbi:MAG: MarR family winged helix-turn-helix transcriptional regulator [Rudaea sp.]